jgi:hypothetical protein
VARHILLGKYPPDRTIREGGGNVGMTWWPFATMLERADTAEAIGLNRSRLRSSRPVELRPEIPPLHSSKQGEAWIHAHGPGAIAPHQSWMLNV